MSKKGIKQNQPFGCNSVFLEHYLTKLAISYFNAKIIYSTTSYKNSTKSVKVKKSYLKQ